MSEVLVKLIPGFPDDNLAVAESLEKCRSAERLIIKLFQECGWVFKPSKRSGEPAQLCRFLGLDINSLDLTFNIPQDKIDKVKSVAVEIKARKRFKVKLLARFVGMLQAVKLATGPIVAVMTRSMYHTVTAAPSWSSFVILSDMAKFELNWWLDNIHKVSKYPFSDSLSTTPVAYETASDASGVGHFSYLLGQHRITLASRAFTEEERGQSSTWRELSAFSDTWTSQEVLDRFRGCQISHYTDSKAMASIVTRGSRNPRLQPLVMKAVLALRSAGIVMEAVWLSRDDGIIDFADRGSRDYHHDDISLDFDSMSKIHEKFGSFAVDTFATASNKKGDRFFSRLDVPGSAGCNFFHQRWESLGFCFLFLNSHVCRLDAADSHFCFPPPSLLTRALRHFERCGFENFNFYKVQIHICPYAGSKFRQLWFFLYGLGQVSSTPSGRMESTRPTSSSRWSSSTPASSAGHW